MTPEAENEPGAGRAGRSGPARPSGNGTGARLARALDQGRDPQPGPRALRARRGRGLRPATVAGAARAGRVRHTRGDGGPRREPGGSPPSSRARVGRPRGRAPREERRAAAASAARREEGRGRQARERARAAPARYVYRGTGSRRRRGAPRGYSEGRRSVRARSRRRGRYWPWPSGRRPRRRVAAPPRPGTWIFRGDRGPSLACANAANAIERGRRLGPETPPAGDVDRGTGRGAAAAEDADGGAGHGRGRGDAPRRRRRLRGR